MTDYQQDELDLFSDLEAPSLPLCLYRSPTRGMAARIAEFTAWKDQRGSFGSLVRAHAWTPEITAPTDPAGRCQPGVLHVDLRPHRDGSGLGLKCVCTTADVMLYRGACRHCDWEGPPRDGLSAENPAAEDALDHAWPGWRDLPVVAPPPAENGPRDKYARDRWAAHVASLYPDGWLEAGAPIRTLRTRTYGRRHVPAATPFGGYDVGVPGQQEAPSRPRAPVMRAAGPDGKAPAPPPRTEVVAVAGDAL